MNRFVVRVAQRLAAPVALVVSVVGLGACSPAFNWREVRVEPTALVALLPCKPDQGTREVVLGGQALSLHMLGCDVDTSTFAVSYIDLPDASQVPAVLAQWKAAMLSTMRATQTRELPATVKGVATAANGSALPLLLVQAQGTRPDGRAVVAQGVWFARDRQLFHAVMYADRVNPDVADAFLSGLQLK